MQYKFPVYSSFNTRIAWPILIVFLFVLLIPSMSIAGNAISTVATVNGVSINSSDLTCAIEASLARMLISTNKADSDTTGNPEILQRKTLDRLISIELLYQESLKKRFPGLNEEVERQYKLEVLRAGGEDRLKTALKCNEITPDDFKAAIFRNISINRFLDIMIYSKITVSHKEISAYYEDNKDHYFVKKSVRLQQIFIKIPRMASDKTGQPSEKVQMVHDQASKGADFSNLARKFSDDPVGASTGGDMGLIYKGNLQRSFNTVIFSMTSGAVSQPLQSRNGYHIFKIRTVYPETVRPLSDVSKNIRKILRKKKAEKLVTNLLARLRESAEIVVTDDIGK